MAEELRILHDDTFEADLREVESALVFFTERERSSYHRRTTEELAALFSAKGGFFLAYIDECPLLCRAYGVRVIDSYYLVNRGRVLDSYTPRGQHDVVHLAVWCDAVLADRPRKRRYMEHITSLPASEMVAYLTDMEAEEKATSQQIRSVLMQLDQSLGTSEEVVHQFLWRNAFLLDLFYEGGYIVSKFPLGDRHVTDFVVVGYRNWTNDFGIHATLLEIENPTSKLFTKNGDPAATLIHALRQVHDWGSWLSNNSEYFRRTLQARLLLASGDQDSIKSTRSLSGFYRDVVAQAMNQRLSYGFKIIAGRRTDMTIGDRMRLDEMNGSLNGISVMTYDALLDGWMKRLGSVV